MKALKILHGLSRPVRLSGLALAMISGAAAVAGVAAVALLAGPAFAGPAGPSGITRTTGSAGTTGTAAPVRPAAPLAHTFSIVARDPLTGDFGVAVQSHWFQVGSSVPWAEAGVGAVATQSFVEPAYGPRGLALMQQGVPAPEALKRLLDADPQRDVRQVAMVDAAGRVAAWTGKKCIAAAGDATGEGFSVQANLMDRPTVWPAMAAAFRAAKGDLADRMLAALDAAQKEGGDIRGRQSAALIVVRALPSAEPGHDRLVDLRVDDNPRPLDELRRLLTLHRAYDAMNQGDAAMAKNDVEEAVRQYSAASKIAPQIAELPFWQAVSLFAAGREAEALPIFRKVFAEDDGRWVRLVPRLPAAGLLPDDPKKLERIQQQAPGNAPGQ